MAKLLVMNGGDYCCTGSFQTVRCNFAGCGWPKLRICSGPTKRSQGEGEEGTTGSRACNPGPTNPPTAAPLQREKV